MNVVRQSPLVCRNTKHFWWTSLSPTLSLATCHLPEIGLSPCSNRLGPRCGLPAGGRWRVLPDFPTLHLSAHACCCLVFGIWRCFWKGESGRGGIWRNAHFAPMYLPLSVAVHWSELPASSLLPSICRCGISLAFCLFALPPQNQAEEVWVVWAGQDGTDTPAAMQTGLFSNCRAARSVENMQSTLQVDALMNQSAAEGVVFLVLFYSHLLRSLPQWTSCFLSSKDWVELWCAP